MKNLFIISLFLLFTINSAKSQTITEAWRSENIFATPESVFYDGDRQQMYISNINGQPTDKDGNGFISLLLPDGTIKNLNWVEGLNAPKGMAVYGGMLFVTDIDRIAIINIKTGSITQIIDVPGSQFLNDMISDQEGRVYISDMATNKLHIYENGKITVWLDDDQLISPNGLAIENGQLLVGCKNYLLSIDLETRKISVLVNKTGGIDGLIPLGNERYVISDWSGKIQMISPATDPVILQNTTEQKIQAADLGFIKETNTIIIPTFFNNGLVAIKLNQ